MYNNIICQSIFFIIGAIFIPSPSDHHFIWPLSNCLMADICNHTWIPECGKEKEDLRRFIDECDLFEYNCDYERNYELVNYSDCFQPATGCPKARPCPPKIDCKKKKKNEGPAPPVVGPPPQLVSPPPPVMSLPPLVVGLPPAVVGPLPPVVSLPPQAVGPPPRRARKGPQRGHLKFQRMGDHYHGPFISPERRSAMTIRTPPVSLPMRMLKGKRRYTPQPRRKTLHRIGITRSTTKSTITKPLYSGTTVKMVVLKRETIFRNGKKILRVVKGPAIYAELYNDQKSDFLENR